MENNDKKNELIKHTINKIFKGEIKISDLQSSTEYYDEILLKVVSDNPKYFAELRADQRNEENALIFVKHVLNTSQLNREKEVYYYKTMNSSPALNIHYESYASEAVDYFDNDLELPTQVKSKLSFSVIIENAIEMLNKLNIDLKDFSLLKIYTTIRKEINYILKPQILEYHKREKLGFFKLEYACNTLESEVERKLSTYLSLYGMKVINFKFEKLFIPEQVTEIIQKEYINARSISIRSKAELQWAESSLEILKLKSEILNQYNLPSDTLSEMEKDKALERYLRKINNQSRKEVDLQKSKDNSNNVEGVLIVTKPVKPVKPAEVQDIKLSKIVVSGVIAFLSLVLAIIGFVVEVEIIGYLGIICMIIFGINLSTNIIKKRKLVSELEVYKEAMNNYNDELIIYNKNKDTYDEAYNNYLKNTSKFFIKDDAIYEKKISI